MNVERLIAMANDIAAYFQADSDHDAAVEGMVVHLQRFWEPRMRARIAAHVHIDDGALLPFAREAVLELARRLDQAPPPPKPDGGGDAG